MARRGKPRFDIEAHLADIERLASLGLNQQEICLSLGFSVTTICKYKKISAELANAIKRGKAAAHKELTNTLFNAATKDANLSACMFLLKSQFNYRDHGPLPGEEEEAHSTNVTIQYIEMDGRKAYKPTETALTQAQQSGNTGENENETERDGEQHTSLYDDPRNGGYLKRIKG